MSDQRKLLTCHAISGGGSTAEAIIKACNPGGILDDLVVPCLVITSNPDENRTVLKGGNIEVPIVRILPEDYEKPHLFGEALLRACNRRGVTFWCQNGWLPWTPRCVVEKYAQNSLNQHCASIDQPDRPDFGGKHMRGITAIAAQLFFMRRMREVGQGFIEATAQWVAPRYDEGLLVHTEALAIRPDHTPESLQRELRPIEHRVLIEALRMTACGEEIMETRDEPLILPHEAWAVEEAKRAAVTFYPHGVS